MGVTIRYRYGKKSKDPKYVIRNKLRIHKYLREDGTYGLRITKSRYMGRVENDPERKTSTQARIEDKPTNGLRRSHVTIG